MNESTVPLLVVGGLTKCHAIPSRTWTRAEAASVCTVRDVSFTLERGEVLGIIGESGSGKTTLARMLLRLVEPTSGSVRLDGRDVLQMDANEERSFLRPRARMIFQDPDSALNPAYTIGVGLARAIRLHDRAIIDTDVEARVRTLLDAVGLPASTARQYPDQLSGGEKRRIGISRALCTNPSLLVADEPLSGLDVVLQEHVLSLLLAEQARRQFGLLLVSHDLDRVRQVCDRVLVMHEGRVVETVAVQRGVALRAYSPPPSYSPSISVL